MSACARFAASPPSTGSYVSCVPFKGLAAVLQERRHDDLLAMRERPFRRDVARDVAPRVERTPVVAGHCRRLLPCLDTRQHRVDALEMEAEVRLRTASESASCSACDARAMRRSATTETAMDAPVAKSRGSASTGAMNAAGTAATAVPATIR